MQARPLACVLAGVLIHIWVAHASFSSEGPPLPPPALRVMSFGYLPNASDASGYLKQKCAAAISDRALHVHSSTSCDAGKIYSLYNSAALADLFGTGEASMDVVEIDAVSLPWLQSMGLIQPMPERYNTSNTIPFILGSTTIDGVVYGAPSWLCTQVLYSRTVDLATMFNISQLSEAVTNQIAAALAASLATRTTPLYLYLGALGALYGTAAMGPELNPFLGAPVDPAALAALQDFDNLCSFNGSNPCMDSSAYCKDTFSPVDEFSMGDASLFAGYTEYLNYAAAAFDFALPPISMAPFLLNPPEQPVVMFADAYAISAHCVDDCLIAAMEFIECALSNDIRYGLSMSHDLPEPRAPRYSMPATLDFWSNASVLADPVYQQITNMVLRDNNMYMPTSNNLTEINTARNLVRSALNVTCSPGRVGQFSAADPNGGSPGAGAGVSRDRMGLRSLPPSERYSHLSPSDEHRREAEHWASLGGFEFMESTETRFFNAPTCPMPPSPPPGAPPLSSEHEMAHAFWNSHMWVLIVIPCAGAALMVGMGIALYCCCTKKDDDCFHGGGHESDTEDEEIRERRKLVAKAKALAAKNGIGAEGGTINGDPNRLTAPPTPGGSNSHSAEGDPPNAAAAATSASASASSGPVPGRPVNSVGNEAAREVARKGSKAEWEPIKGGNRAERTYQTDDGARLV